MIMSNTKENILLTGYRATGKSLIGRMLADRLGYRFVDTDAELCRQQGQTVAEIVAAHGWQAFRRMERLLLSEMIGNRLTVLAVGGGAIEHEDIWSQLRTRYVVVWLKADVNTILRRMSADRQTAGQRPPLTDNSIEEEVVQVLARRTPLYAAGSDLVVDTAGGKPEALAASLLHRLIKEGYISSITPAGHPLGGETELYSE